MIQPKRRRQSAGIGASGHVTVYVPAHAIDAFKRLEQLAGHNHYSLSSLIVDAVYRYVDKPPDYVQQ